jgi:hypothetical protein
MRAKPWEVPTSYGSGSSHCCRGSRARDLADSLRYSNHERHTGRLTRGRLPADIVYAARKMETR